MPALGRRSTRLAEVPWGPGRLARALGRLAAAVVAVAAAVAVTGPARPAWATPLPVAAEPRAAACITPEGEVAVGQVLVVVAFPSGVVARCAAPGGSGIDTLRAAGFTVEAAGYSTVGGAAAVCAIGQPPATEVIGCATGPSCLTCADPLYWQYYRCWAYSGAGGGGTRPTGGTIEGWRWASSTGWPVDARPAACDTDGDDVVTPVAPPPTSPPPSRPGPGDARPGNPSGPGSGGQPGPGSGGQPGPPGDEPRTGGASPDGGRPPGDDIDDRTEPGPTPDQLGGEATTTDPEAPDRPGSPPAGDPDRPARPGSDRGDGEEGAAAAVAPGRGDDGGDGGSPLVPVAVTAGVVGLLGAAAIGLRRRRGATAIAQEAS